MDFATLKAIFQDNILNGLALGMGTWFFTWGLNRVYLRIKSSINF